MKASTVITSLLIALAVSIVQAAPDSPTLQHKLTVTPEIKKAFLPGDDIEIRSVTGTAPKFQTGGTYRVTGTCRQQTLMNATLYLGNTAEPGSDAIVANKGSSLSKPLPNGTTEFDITFTLLRPGLLHITIYDLDNHDKNDNAYAGLYLGSIAAGQILVEARAIRVDTNGMEEVVASPRAVTSDGMRATLSVTRALKVPDSIGGSDEPVHTGSILDVTPTVDGDSIRFRTHLTVREASDESTTDTVRNMAVITYELFSSGSVKAGSAVSLKTTNAVSGVLTWTIRLSKFPG